MCRRPATELQNAVLGAEREIHHGAQDVALNTKNAACKGPADNHNAWTASEKKEEGKKEREKKKRQREKKGGKEIKTIDNYEACLQASVSKCQLHHENDKITNLPTNSTTLLDLCVRQRQRNIREREREKIDEERKKKRKRKRERTRDNERHRVGDNRSAEVRLGIKLTSNYQQ